MKKGFLLLMMLFVLGACNLEEAKEKSEDVNNTQYNENNFIPNYGTWQENQRPVESEGEGYRPTYSEVDDYPYHLPYCDSIDEKGDEETSYLSFYGHSADRVKVSKRGGRELCILREDEVDRDEIEREDYEFECDQHDSD